MKKAGPAPSLHRPALYQIRISGQLDESWSDWVEGLTIRIESGDDGPPFTTMTGNLDQAALQGLLRRLYSLGLPLVSVTCLESGFENGSGSCRNDQERQTQGKRDEY